MKNYVDAEKIFGKIAEMTMPGNNDYQLGYNDCLDEIEQFFESTPKQVKCGCCTSYCKRDGQCNKYGGHWDENDFCSKGVPIS